VLRRVIELCLNWRKTVVAVTALMFAAALAGFGLVQQQFFPTSTRSGTGSLSACSTTKSGPKASVDMLFFVRFGTSAKRIPRLRLSAMASGSSNGTQGAAAREGKMAADHADDSDRQVVPPTRLLRLPGAANGRRGTQFRLNANERD
jgi:hypothetical protein